MIVRNPVVSGFYPDPSICYAEGKFYLACSSFQYLPGVPIFETEDLVNYTQIGHCLTRPNQVELHRINSSGGVFAPTIRYNNGRFYMVTNNNTFGKNFYVFTDDIRGEWSDPIYVDQEGIDPSLLFDDGKVYFTSNGTDENGLGCIIQCEIDIESGRKLSESIPIWHGSGGRYLESPHLYHIGDYYYLMVAEGGTEYGHMITIARSKDAFGPFESYEKNPILTNRNLGGNISRIQGIGHGDLIQDEDGNFFIVCLGFRQSGEWSAYHHLGREVFLAGASLSSDGWFEAGDNGIVKRYMDINVPCKRQNPDVADITLENGLDDFRWIYLRDYNKDNYKMDGEELVLRGCPITLDDADSPTFVAVRQTGFDASVLANVSSDAEEAGITIYMDEMQHYDIFLEKENDTYKAVLRLHVGDAISRVSEVLLGYDFGSTSKCTLEVKASAEQYEFFIHKDGERIFMGKARTKYLSSEVAGGFTGVVIGLFAVSNELKEARFSDLKIHMETRDN